MKEKLTLTVDRKAIAEAKKFARRNRTSLSQMVEDQFRKLSHDSFADRWYGKFKVPDPDPDDPRLTYLLRKYVHNR
ncbi:MAG: hypothetical protein H0X40_05820 [Chthoniobacterales bacterium]|nr:hypothetical protein [Chthoniobacterales bacterium]